MENDFQIRRQHLRVYPQQHECDVVHGSMRGVYKLVSLSHEEARLVAVRNALDEVQEGDAVAINLRISDKGVETGEIPAKVNYVEGEELSLIFASNILAALMTLQNAMGD